jgi:hypothetical protein
MSQLIHPLQVLERFAPHDFSVFDFFTKRVHTLGSAPMVEFENTVLSWNECAVWVDKASAWLLDQGNGLAGSLLFSGSSLRYLELKILASKGSDAFGLDLAIFSSF